MAVGVPSFAAFLEEERAHVEEALGRALDRVLPLFPERLRGPASHGVRAGGKRLRPILTRASFLACGGAGAGRDRAELGGGLREAVYDLAVAVELIHAYSLMHDDLPCMDDAPLRRGQPTPHTLFGVADTTLAGALLIPAAGIWSWEATGRLGLALEARREALGLLARAAGAEGMVGGQALDLLAENRTLSRESLDELHGMKTGALLQVSLALGALAAGASPTIRGAIERYGRAIGLAFQIIDDVLDATADAEALGKTPSDQEMGKATYVSLLGVESAREKASEWVDVAVSALRDARLESPALESLALHIIRRDR